jgi:hypothetical protein
MRNMAIRTLGAHATTVREMDGALKFRIHVGTHFMGARKELLRVDQLAGIEGGTQKSGPEPDGCGREFLPGPIC